MVKKKYNNRKLNVVKVPLDYFPNNYAARFPPMPILYLELLENKDKVKKDLRTKDYVPSPERMTMTNIPTTDQAKDQEDKDIDKDFEIKDYSSEYPEKRGKREPLKILDLSEPKPEKYIYEEKEQDEPKQEKREKISDEDEPQDRYEKESRKNDEKEDDNRIREKLQQRFSRLKDKYKSDDIDENEPKHHSDSDREDFKQNDDPVETSDKYENDIIPEQSDGNQTPKSQKEDETQNFNDTQKKLFDLLKNDDTSFPDKSDTKFDERRDERFVEKIKPKTVDNMPPRFSELNSGVVRDNKGVRDVTRGLTKQEEEEELEKRLLLDKFSILKKKYKEAKIPDFNTYTDFTTMKRTYDSIVRQLQLDSTVDNYKRYLMLGFTATQWLVTKFLKIDMSGFAEQQILSINQYETLLIEIGEKSYFKGPSQMSPELKLIGLIGFNAVIFIFSKMIFKTSGDNVLGSINKINDSSRQQQQSSAPKPHMRGPNFDDLKDIENLSRKTKNE